MEIGEWRRALTNCLTGTKSCVEARATLKVNNGERVHTGGATQLHAHRLLKVNSEETFAAILRAVADQRADLVCF